MTTHDLLERLSQDALLRSVDLFRLVLDAIPAGVVVMDAQGEIVLSNPAAERIWSAVIPDPSARYARTRAWWYDTGKPVEPHEWGSQRALSRGETSLEQLVEIEAYDGTRRIIQNSAVPIRDSRSAIVGAVVVNEDITERKNAEAALEASATQLRGLAARLMDVQDEARRRIARMLHETMAQDLAALKMLLARLTRTSDRLSGVDRDLLGSAIQLADGSMSGIRTLSYLLHPPLLDEAGLLSAVRWYAEGFAARSGIAVDLDVPPEFQRLPQDLETTLFRVVQEALINIHRHAESPTARIRLAIVDGGLSMEIADRGRGIPADLVARLRNGEGAMGVGIAGMRERLTLLGGTLDIESTSAGTTVRVGVPLELEGV